MLWSDSEIHVLHRHATGVIRRSAGQPRPERTDFFQMSPPIMDLSVENGPQLFVLPDIGVKMTQQNGQALFSADTIIKTALRVHLHQNRVNHERRFSKSTRVAVCL